MEGGKAILKGMAGGGRWVERGAGGWGGVTGDLVFLWLQLCGWWALQCGGMTRLNQALPLTPAVPQFSSRHHLPTGNDFIWFQLH